MTDYVLSCCSPCDLPKEYFKEHDLKLLYFHFELGNDTYQDDMGESIAPHELFSRMLAGEITKTSQASPAEYEEFFEAFLKEGKDVLHITLSGGLSGTVNSARLAAQALEERYPERKVLVADSLGASAGYGLLMDYLVEKRDQGAGIEELYAYAEEIKLNIHHWFFSTDLTFYIRGGRVSKAAGMIGTMLKICPLLNVDSDGLLIPREKVRGKKQVSKRIVTKMLEHAEGGADYSGRCFISHSDCYEDARNVADMIEAAFPKLYGKVRIFPICATVGSHTGPGTVALFFMGDRRTK